jgi:hypothetical protein
MQEIRATIPDLQLLLWFDLSPKTPKVWEEQPAEWWMPAIAFQSAFREGQEIERDTQASAAAAKKQGQS